MARMDAQQQVKSGHGIESLRRDATHDAGLGLRYGLWVAALPWALLAVGICWLFLPGCWSQWPAMAACGFLLAIMVRLRQVRGERAQLVARMGHFVGEADAVATWCGLSSTAKQGPSAQWLRSWLDDRCPVEPWPRRWHKGPLRSVWVALLLAVLLSLGKFLGSGVDGLLGPGLEQVVAADGSGGGGAPGGSGQGAGMGVGVGVGAGGSEAEPAPDGEPAPGEQAPGEQAPGEQEAGEGETSDQEPPDQDPAQGDLDPESDPETQPKEEQADPPQEEPTDPTPEDPQQGPQEPPKSPPPPDGAPSPIPDLPGYDVLRAPAFLDDGPSRKQLTPVWDVEVAPGAAEGVGAGLPQGERSGPAEGGPEAGGKPSPPPPEDDFAAALERALRQRRVPLGERRILQRYARALVQQVAVQQAAVPQGKVDRKPKADPR